MRKNFTTKVLSVTIIALLSLILFFNSAYSYPGGIAGKTLKHTANGCGSCHSFGTTTTGAFTGPDTVLAGQTIQFTLTINKTQSGLIGVDIAAKNGTLNPGAGSQYVKLMSGELVHANNGISGSSVTINFNYTAPSAAGIDTLHATVDAGYSGKWNWAPGKRIVVKTTSGIINNSAPVSFALNQNYPNPFNPVTKINYSIAKSGNVKLTVYNILGNEIMTLVNGKSEAGNYSVIFDGANLSSGVYFYKLETESFTDVKRMTLLK